MVEQIPRQAPVTLGADKGYDRKEFVQEMREHRVTPAYRAQVKPVPSMSAPLAIRATRLVSKNANG